MTRRERIAAERLAAGLAPRAIAADAMTLAAPAVVAPGPGVAMPVDADGAPMSPDVSVAMPPEQSTSVFDAPAPSSPDVVAAVPTVAETIIVEPVESAPVVEPAPVVEAAPAVVAAPVVEPAPAAFSVSAPVAAQSPAARRATERTVRRVQRVADRSATRPTRSGSSFRRRASAFSGGAVLLVVAGLVVGTSVPAQAFYTPPQSPGLRAAAAAVDDQSLKVGASGEGADAVANRDGYSVTDAVVIPQNTSGTFTNDPNGTIQWPFPVGVPISSGFGARNVAGCSFCSTFHEGIDFAPGQGTPIGSVAAGTVIKVKADDGGYGNDVWVQHDVDGEQFVSVYGHMKDGSFKVVQGQTVTVGQELGEVGSTGNSTGPHLHLEIHVNDVPVDPLAWLKANAN
ncbi:hypothetical protein ASF23_11120 [Curtobacterium sp. Leaf261]|nr:hypothetical protein ASF23_11120 [Curtobacterium sp. Leaf261]